MTERGHPMDVVAGAQPDHPLLAAISPLVSRIGAEIVAPDRLAQTDVPLVWKGKTIAGVRLRSAEGAGRAEAVGDLSQILDDLALELGSPLRDLPRAQKQRAVRLLEERGAFAYRKSAETVADALGVTRFTVYNYLNRDRG